MATLKLGFLIDSLPDAVSRPEGCFRAVRIIASVASDNFEAHYANAAKSPIFCHLDSQEVFWAPFRVASSLSNSFDRYSISSLAFLTFLQYCAQRVATFADSSRTAALKTPAQLKGHASIPGRARMGYLASSSNSFTDIPSSRALLELAPKNPTMTES
ncbi:hypothetical protein EAE96_000004 [Botrytis aclada]|nr:hypothetical protein EAE96_000004 [Botrytis aclada]